MEFISISYQVSKMELWDRGNGVHVKVISSVTHYE